MNTLKCWLRDHPHQVIWSWVIATCSLWGVAFGVAGVNPLIAGVFGVCWSAASAQVLLLVGEELRARKKRDDDVFHKWIQLRLHILERQRNAGSH